VVIVISHDYSLPLSKLFCLKGSLNLKERRGNFLVVFWESCTFRMVQCNPRSRSVWPHFSAWKYTSRKRKKYRLKTRSTLQLGINYCLKLLVEALRYKLEVRIYDLQWDHCDVFFVWIRDNGTHSTKAVEGTFACVGICLLILRHICLQS